jgi:hypothetical protein
MSLFDHFHRYFPGPGIRCGHLFQIGSNAISMSRQCLLNGRRDIGEAYSPG